MGENFFFKSSPLRRFSLATAGQAMNHHDGRWRCWFSIVNNKTWLGSVWIKTPVFCGECNCLNFLPILKDPSRNLRFISSWLSPFPLGDYGCWWQESKTENLWLGIAEYWYQPSGELETWSWKRWSSESEARNLSLDYFLKERIKYNNNPTPLPTKKSYC